MFGWLGSWLGRGGESAGGGGAPADLGHDQIRHDLISQPFGHTALSLDPSGGETLQMREAYLDLYQKEGVVRAAINGLVDAVASADVTAEPFDRSKPESRDVAEFLMWSVDQSEGGWPTLITDTVLPALLFGYSLGEPRLQLVSHPTRGGQLALYHLRSLDTRFLRLRTDVFRNVTEVISTVRGLEPFDPAKLVLFTYRRVFHNPFGNPAMRAAYRDAALIEDAYSIWYYALKMYSEPYIYGKYEKEVHKGQLLAALKALRRGGVLVTSKQDEVQLLNLASATNFAGFEAKVRNHRENVFLAVRGAYLPFVEGTGGPDARGDTEVGKLSSDQSEYLLSQAVARCLDKQLVPHLIYPNFGPGTPLPKLKLGGLNWDKIKNAGDTLKQVKDAFPGRLSMSAKRVAAILGIPPAEGPDDEINVNEPGPDDKGPGGPGGGPASPLPAGSATPGPADVTPPAPAAPPAPAKPATSFSADEVGSYADHFLPDQHGRFPGTMHEEYGLGVGDFARRTGLARKEVGRGDNRRWLWVPRPPADGPVRTFSADPPAGTNARTPGAAELAVAMLEAYAAGDDDTADALAELAADPDGLAEFVADFEGGHQGTPGRKAFAAMLRTFAAETRTFSWTPDPTPRSKTRITNTESGAHAYGKTAAAIMARQGREDRGEPEPEHPARAKARQLRQEREPARAAARQAWQKATTDPASLTPEDVVALRDHLDTLTRDEVRETVKAIRGGGHGGKLKAELVDALHQHAQELVSHERGKESVLREAIGGYLAANPKATDEEVIDRFGRGRPEVAGRVLAGVRGESGKVDGGGEADADVLSGRAAGPDVGGAGRRTGAPAVVPDAGGVHVGGGADLGAPAGSPGPDVDATDEGQREAGTGSPAAAVAGGGAAGQRPEPERYAAAFKQHAADGLAGKPGRTDVALRVMNDFRSRASVQELREFARHVGVGDQGTRNQIGERLVSYALNGPDGAAKTAAEQQRRDERDRAERRGRSTQAAPRASGLGRAGEAGPVAEPAPVGGGGGVNRHDGAALDADPAAVGISEGAERVPLERTPQGPKKPGHSTPPSGPFYRPASELTDDEARAELAANEERYRGPFGPATAKPPAPGSPEFNRDLDRRNELSERLGKMAWQRPRDAVQRVAGMPPEKHRQYVEQALAAGKPVPPEVLADYPDLASPQPAPPPAVAEAPIDPWSVKMLMPSEAGDPNSPWAEHSVHATHEAAAAAAGPDGAVHMRPGPKTIRGEGLAGIAALGHGVAVPEWVAYRPKAPEVPAPPAAQQPPAAPPGPQQPPSGGQSEPRRHTIAIPKDKRRLTIDQAHDALAQMGYKVGLPTTRKVGNQLVDVFPLTNPDGTTANVSHDEIRQLVYDGAAHPPGTKPPKAPAGGEPRPAMTQAEKDQALADLHEEERRRKAAHDAEHDPPGGVDDRAEPYERARDHLERMQRWAADRPESVAASGAVARAAERLRRTTGQEFSDTPTADPTHAGLCVRAADTGRVLVLRRAATPGDPAAGLWEFPGGKIEPGETPEAAACREWAEEVGTPVPDGVPFGKWRGGVYAGHVLTVPTEAAVPLDGRAGDRGEAVAWRDPDSLAADDVRPELVDSLGDVTRAFSDGKPPRPGLVPQTGDAQHPGHWVRPKDAVPAANPDHTLPTPDVQTPAPADDAKPADGASGRVARAVAAVKRLGSAALSTRVGRILVAAEHRLSVVQYKVRAVATEAAKRRKPPLDADGVERLTKALFIADFVGGYVTGAAAAAFVHPIAGKVAAFLPSVSALYLGYTTIRHPLAVWAAARAVAAATLAGTAATHAAAGDLADRLAALLGGADADWREAVFLASLAETQNPDRAVEVAAAAGPMPDELPEPTAEDFGGDEDA